MEKQQSESNIVKELNNLLYNMKQSGEADVRDLKTIAEAIENLKKENTLLSYKIYLLSDDKRQLEKDNYRLLKDNRNLQEEVSSLRKRCGIDIFKEM